MGDVMLGRLVNETIKKTSYRYPWGNTLPFLLKNDFNIINLETTITNHNIPTPKVFNFKTDPNHANVLSAGNIHVASIANNHILDYGYTGLFDTMEALQKAQIKYVGAGKNIQQAQAFQILEKNTIKIGVVGFTDNEPTWKASATTPGTNYIAIGDIEAIKKTIAPLKGKVDYIVATIHWGPNMRERPTQEFVTFAHALIDAGIDILHGHSAHIFQGIEMYKNKLIMYDTGDFIDDYMVTPQLRNDLSFIYVVHVDKQNINRLQVIPTRIEHMQVNIATGEDRIWSLQRIQELSKRFGTTVSDSGLIMIYEKPTRISPDGL
jgi:poly-gamma-glutamate capsule biosynthesis protein CapA/YwtB (metallophosphatase superfamily)